MKEGALRRISGIGLTIIGVPNSLLGVGGTLFWIILLILRAIEHPGSVPEDSPLAPLCTVCLIGMIIFIMIVAVLLLAISLLLILLASGHLVGGISALIGKNNIGSIVASSIGSLFCILSGVGLLLIISLGKMDPGLLFYILLGLAIFELVSFLVSVPLIVMLLIACRIRENERSKNITRKIKKKDDKRVERDGSADGGYGKTENIE